MSRTKRSIRNIVVTVVCQILMTAVGFAARKVFLLSLDADYLGLSSLFGSVLTVLSLAELGIGPAMIFSLYKPLAENDIEVCRSLMKIYRKTYRIIGFVVLGAGLIVSPFVEVFLKDVPPQIGHLHFIFVLFVVDTAVSYFYSYKRSLIIASQSQYKIDSVHAAAYVARNAVQALLLFLTGNYYIFIGVQIASTLLENITLSRWASRQFPWLDAKGETDALPQQVRAGVVRNVKAMVFHRVGGIVVDATDNILISQFFGLTFLGLYSNYLLAINALQGFISSAFSAVSASIGDFGARKDAGPSYALYRKIYFLNFWIASFSSTCLFVLLPLFIRLIYGSEYVINTGVFAVVSVNFYINCMRRTILTFKESYGLPWFDRYKPLVGAAVNVAASILLAVRYGVIGVFIGTTVTHLCVNVWVEAKVVFNHAFERKLIDFFKDYVPYALLAGAMCALTAALCSLLSAASWLNFFLAAGVCLVLPNGLLWLLFHRREEFRYFVGVIRGCLPSKK